MVASTSTSSSATRSSAARRNSSGTKPGAAHRNRAGASAGGSGTSTTPATTIIGTTAHSFDSGPAHTAVLTTPPGRSTRAISRAAAARSGKNMKPNRQETESNDASSNGSALASASRSSTFAS